MTSLTNSPSTPTTPPPSVQENLKLLKLGRSVSEHTDIVSSAINSSHQWADVKSASLDDATIDTLQQQSDSDHGSDTTPDTDIKYELIRIIPGGIAPGGKNYVKAAVLGGGLAYMGPSCFAHDRTHRIHVKDLGLKDRDFLEAVLSSSPPKWWKDNAQSRYTHWGVEHQCIPERDQTTSDDMVCDNENAQNVAFIANITLKSTGRKCAFGSNILRDDSGDAVDGDVFFHSSDSSWNVGDIVKATLVPWIHTTKKGSTHFAVINVLDHSPSSSSTTIRKIPARLNNNPFNTLPADE
jgi:hypothetical protein